MAAGSKTFLYGIRAMHSGAMLAAVGQLFALRVRRSQGRLLGESGHTMEGLPCCLTLRTFCGRRFEQVHACDVPTVDGWIKKIAHPAIRTFQIPQDKCPKRGTGEERCNCDDQRPTEVNRCQHHSTGGKKPIWAARALRSSRDICDGWTTGGRSARRVVSCRPTRGTPFARKRWRDWLGSGL